MGGPEECSRHDVALEIRREKTATTRPGDGEVRPSRSSRKEDRHMPDRDTIERPRGQAPGQGRVHAGRRVRQGRDASHLARASTARACRSRRSPSVSKARRAGVRTASAGEGQGVGGDTPPREADLAAPVRRAPVGEAFRRDDAGIVARRPWSGLEGRAGRQARQSAKKRGLAPRRRREEGRADEGTACPFPLPRRRPRGRARVAGVAECDPRYLMVDATLRRPSERGGFTARSTMMI